MLYNVFSLTCRPGWQLMCSSFPCTHGPWGSRRQGSEGSVWGLAGSTEQLSHAENVNCNSYLWMTNKNDYVCSELSDEPECKWSCNNSGFWMLIGVFFFNQPTWLHLHFVSKTLDQTLLTLTDNAACLHPVLVDLNQVVGQVAQLWLHTLRKHSVPLALHQWTLALF